MGKRLSDSEIMTNVLDKLRYSANEFAQRLEYKSASSVYNVIKEIGGAKISISMADKIIECFPDVNYMYSTRGELPNLKDASKSVGLQNILNLGKSNATFEDMPGTLKNKENLLIEIRDKMNE